MPERHLLLLCVRGNHARKTPPSLCVRRGNHARKTPLHHGEKGRIMPERHLSTMVRREESCRKDTSPPWWKEKHAGKTPPGYAGRGRGYPTTLPWYHGGHTTPGYTPRYLSLGTPTTHSTLLHCPTRRCCHTEVQALEHALS